MFKQMLKPGLIAGIIGGVVSILFRVLLILALLLPGQVGITLYCMASPIGLLLSLGIGLLAAFLAQTQSLEKLTANKAASPASSPEWFPPLSACRRAAHTANAQLARPAGQADRSGNYRLRA